LSKDAYDLFELNKKYGNVISIISKNKSLILNEINVLNYNLDEFNNNETKITNYMSVYTFVQTGYSDVKEFILKLKQALS